MAGDHTAAMLLGGGPGTSTIDPTTIDPSTVDFGFGAIAGAFFVACLAAIPLGISLWALLDAARRPRWAWALAGRRQVVWMAVIMFGILSVVGGLLISGYYLWRVRPSITAAESGRF